MKQPAIPHSGADDNRKRRTPALRHSSGRALRVAHLTTIDLSLVNLLGTELRYDVENGFATYGISAPGPYAERLFSLGVEHVPIRSLTRTWDLRADLAAARELTQVLRRLDLDVLHAHTPKAGVLGRLLGRAAGVPVIVNTCHGLWLRPGDSALRRAFVLGSEAISAWASHAELYQNAEDRRRLHWAIASGRSAVVGNGVNLDAFYPDPAGGAAVRRELGIRPDELVVGGVGRMVAEKGIAEFAAAARGLGLRAHFVWVGPDDPDKSDAWSAEATGVRFLGMREDMRAVYSALDVFVLPSYREGFSRSAMEAAACARPMVLSDIRGCREVGDHDRHLLLAPPGDPVALTAAVGRLLDDPDLRHRLGTAARGRALAEFDQRRVARTSIATYAAVARRRQLGWIDEGRAVTPPA